MISHWDEAETERAELPDVIYYPRRNAMYFRGAGVMIPAESIGFRET